MHKKCTKNKKCMICNKSHHFIHGLFAVVAGVFALSTVVTVWQVNAAQRPTSPATPAKTVSTAPVPPPPVATTLTVTPKNVVINNLNAPAKTNQVANYFTIKNNSKKTVQLMKINWLFSSNQKPTGSYGLWKVNGDPAVLNLTVLDTTTTTVTLMGVGSVNPVDTLGDGYVRKMEMPVAINAYNKIGQKSVYALAPNEEMTIVVTADGVDKAKYDTKNPNGFILSSAVTGIAWREIGTTLKPDVDTSIVSAFSVATFKPIKLSAVLAANTPMGASSSSGEQAISRMTVFKDATPGNEGAVLYGTKLSLKLTKMILSCQSNLRLLKIYKNFGLGAEVWSQDNLVGSVDLCLQKDLKDFYVSFNKQVGLTAESPMGLVFTMDTTDAVSNSTINLGLTGVNWTTNPWIASAGIDTSLKLAGATLVY